MSITAISPSSTSSTSPPPKTQRLRAGQDIGPLTPHLFVPTAERPVRAKLNRLDAETRVVPHSHRWAQLAYSATGVVRVTAERDTYLVPPSRAVWIPPEVEHAVTVVEDCELRTLYFHQPPGVCGPRAALGDATGDDIEEAGSWSRCRVLEVTELLRALVLALPTQDDAAGPPPPNLLRHERLAAPLVAEELCTARPVPLGVSLPADKRLRTLCEAMLDDPGKYTTIEDWSRDVGASPRTIARLFRTELATSFGQWRQQALLARAVTLAAQGRAMNQIASDLGYASASAFSAMVRRSLGAPPSRFFASHC